MQYDEGVAADGALLVASYQCATHGNHGTAVRRLDASNGAPVWEWSTPDLLPADNKWFTVVDAAESGNAVVVIGQSPQDSPAFLAALGRATSWPSSLGPSCCGETVLALDANSGHARWNEIGAQQQLVSLVDGAVCETVPAGLECRDDVTGAQTRPVFTSGYGQGASPPYGGDGYAGISGKTAAAAISTSATDSVSVNIMPIRGTNDVAHLKVDIGATTADGSRYGTFVVGSGQLTNGATLVLLRRIDLNTYPLLAVSVAPHARTAQR